ncbi:myo-inositol-1(or 4)-monophosphatase [Paracoccus isoporae]|uniref:Myo-inositol-1(Or 4)-monophosphatase n=1 Tax=Paracoccus isoporae TaxID=591205 RepID=A0A1G6V1X0_9RHOB|nr:3'(2'),5'-bisphosphate nucleotidase CysQ [Paracoccus isoporae]SDD47493.1 myo-inositol-1(or 4)-monophosphatase [Paracoccus isoporae]
MPGRSDIDLLIAAAHGSGKIARRYWRREPRIWDKGGGAGPVTEADLAVNDYLIDRLLKARPDYGWLSEESEDGPARLDAEHCFVVDPIDGTRAFIDGQPGYSHSLAVLRGDRVVAGVVYLPEMGLTYAATEDGPAKLNGEVIAASETDLADADILMSKAALKPEHWKGGTPPEFTRSFRPSLAWRLCLVAEGRFDATMSLRPAWEWDIAAGSLIAARAGCTVSNMHGRAMRFNSRAAQVPGLIIAGPKLHGQITERMALAPGVGSSRP